MMICAGRVGAIHQLQSYASNPFGHTRWLLRSCGLHPFSGVLSLGFLGSAATRPPAPSSAYAVSAAAMNPLEAPPIDHSHLPLPFGRRRCSGLHRGESSRDKHVSFCTRAPSIPAWLIMDRGLCLSDLMSGATSNEKLR